MSFLVEPVVDLLAMQIYGVYGRCLAQRGRSRKKPQSLYELKQDQDEWIPCIQEPDKDLKEYRKNWARLIQKIYEVDPLTCLKCSGKMKVISVIEDEEIIKKILKHLGLWDVKPTPPPGTQAAAEKTESIIDDSFSQLPVSDKWLYVDPEYPEVYPA